MTITELANKSGRSRSYIYKRVRELGRLPTLEELEECRIGRPPKYIIQDSVYDQLTIPVMKEILIRAKDFSKTQKFFCYASEYKGEVLRRTPCYPLSEGSPESYQKSLARAKEYAYSDAVASGLLEDIEVQDGVKLIEEIILLTDVLRT